MPFKKDYINYLLYTVVNSGRAEFRDNYRLRKLVDSIISVDDIMKITYLTGKTAGLDILFKYLLYISDKIDKSHVTVFNLKDNFDYDVMNLSKICEKITLYKSENVNEVIENLTEETKLEPQNTVKIDIDETEDTLVNIINAEDAAEDTDEDTGDNKLTLIENADAHTQEAEVFELSNINDSIEDTEEKEETELKDTKSQRVENTESDSDVTEESEEAEPGGKEDIPEQIQQVSDDSEILSEAVEDADITETAENNKVESLDEIAAETPDEKFSEVEIIHKPVNTSVGKEYVKEEAITSEVYYKFENKFFEEVKILEKLFSAVDKECKSNETGKLGEKCLQGLTEIIEITSELANLSRQLSFDLIADIFLTMNLYFTKSISHPVILTGERIRLLDASLALVNSLIKGEDYLNYDSMVDKIEKLKSDIDSYQESDDSEIETTQLQENIEVKNEGTVSEQKTNYEAEPVTEYEAEPVREKEAINQTQMDSANFKLKYLIKEFEKSFMNIDQLKGEYIKYDALEKISELNNILRLIAKISASVKLYDVLKLAEVTYVFLKYVKDYRMNLLEPEIKQIIKYIIFTFKMLLTHRRPEDFNVLVQHLNNPVKIFADS
jgi:hypothetical protein